MFKFGGNKREKVTRINDEGLVFAQKNNLQPALEKFLEAIKADTDFPDPYSNAGNCYRFMNQLPKALEYYTRAIELKPDFFEAYFNRAAVCELLNTAIGLSDTLVGRFTDGVADLETHIQRGAPGKMNMANAKATLEAMRRSVR